MPNSPRIVQRTFVRLLVAAIVAGFLLQTEWAIGHDFEYFDARVFASALLLFMLALGVRVACRRFLPASDSGFDEKYSESLLLLAVTPAFLVVEDVFLRITGLLLYGTIVVRYAAQVLQVEWLRRPMARIDSQAARWLRVIARAPVSYLVEDDVNANGNVLRVFISTREDTEPSVSDIERRSVRCFGDLPKPERFDEVEVDIDGVARIDGRLPRLLDPVSRYATLRGIRRVVVLSREDRMEAAASVLPVDRFAMKASSGD